MRPPSNDHVPAVSFARDPEFAERDELDLHPRIVALRNAHGIPSQAWRPRTAFEHRGPAGLVHGNRGRASPQRIDQERRPRVVALARERYRGLNDCHLADCSPSMRS